MSVCAGSFKQASSPTATSTRLQLDNPATKEDRIQAAAQAFCHGTQPSIHRAAAHFNVAYLTVWNRLHGRKSNKEDHIKWQHLDSIQSLVMLDWCKYQSNMAQPLTCNGLCTRVHDLVSRTPSDSWVHRFLRLHKGEIEVAKGHGLDPKHTQSFNPATVKGHFCLLGNILETYQIPMTNYYNVNKKGIQLGGVARTSPCNFCLPKGHWGHEQIFRVKNVIKMPFPYRLSIHGSG
ncbi:hypothetical protein K439DRAFT_1356593 [Ramaria rubella]|nr:hypothetical protein K439DRAFT_1356593 [Ramaria rubella]